MVDPHLQHNSNGNDLHDTVLSPVVVERINDHAREISVNLADAPISIGRAKTATISVGEGVTRISRCHATIFMRDDGEYWVRDGNGAPSANGIYVMGRKVSVPIRFRPGAEISLLPPEDRDEIILLWPLLKSDVDFTREPPTLSFENEVLRSELKVDDDLISELQHQLTATQAMAQDMISSSERNAAMLRQELKRNRIKNAKQDKALKFLRLTMLSMAALLLIVLWVSIGGDDKKLDSAIKAITGVVGIVSAIASLRLNESEDDN